MSKLRELFNKLLKKKKPEEELESFDSEDQTLITDVDDEEQTQIGFGEETKVTSDSDNTGSFFKKLAAKAKSVRDKKPKRPKKKKAKKVSGGGMTFDELLGHFFSPKARPFFHSFFKFSFALAASFAIAKLLALSLSPKGVSELADAQDLTFEQQKIALETRDISKRNLFNSERTGAQRKKVVKKKKQPKGPCIASDTKTSAGFTLVNTIVLQNESKSIATLKQGGGKNFTNVRSGESVKGLGKVGRIIRQRLFFRNASNNQCEYIAVNVKETKLKNKVKILSQDRGKKLLEELNEDQGITANGNVFEIKREYLNSKLQDLGSILTQAKATPVPNPDGTLSFKITDVVPGSVYTVIGVQNEDFISKIDGKPIRSVNEVLALFRKIKSVSNLNITVRRDGADQVLQYKIK